MCAAPAAQEVAPEAAQLRIVTTVSPITNIVYILADDLGYGDLRCYNDSSAVPTTT